MSTPDYVRMWVELDDRRKELEGELREVGRAQDVIRPLAERQDPAAIQDSARPAPLVRQIPGPVIAADRAATLASAEADQLLEHLVEHRDREAEAGIYRRMSSLDAALHFMRSKRGVVSTPEIADALTAGGFQSTSPNFRVNIYTTMKRLAIRGEVVRVGEGLWALQEDAPLLDRNALAESDALLEEDPN
jgi:hypothetical protein